ncbi:Ribonuclease HI like protein [Aduncisulcus paluster]|uniref:ribonuclease H n=1 Tax=Aduncisulcus paluster TaxID=2918883 RepID=A0ABQ5K098_9EUKA|nr:Ribonuclease HI like protein [Aduncisulcus paluster]
MSDIEYYLADSKSGISDLLAEADSHPKDDIIEVSKSKLISLIHQFTSLTEQLSLLLKSIPPIPDISPKPIIHSEETTKKMTNISTSPKISTSSCAPKPETAVRLELFDSPSESICNEQASKRRHPTFDDDDEDLEYAKEIFPPKKSSIMDTQSLAPKSISYPKNISIYTDGSCIRNPGYGGWGFVVTGDSFEDIEVYGASGSSASTNNTMELCAAIYALQYVRLTKGKFDFDTIHIFSDSQYVVQGIDHWIQGWKKNGWVSSTRKPVKNINLWQKLDEERGMAGFLKVKFHHTKGHNGNKYNERADELARMGSRSRKRINPLDTLSSSSRK